MDEQKEKVIAFIKEYTLSHGYPPARQEIADHVGVNSHGTLCDLMDELWDEGIITGDKKKQRSYILKGLKVVEV